MRRGSFLAVIVRIPISEKRKSKQADRSSGKARGSGVPRSVRPFLLPPFLLRLSPDGKNHRVRCLSPVSVRDGNGNRDVSPDLRRNVPLDVARGLVDRHPGRCVPPREGQGVPIGNSRRAEGGGGAFLPAGG